jgi:transposase
MIFFLGCDVSKNKLDVALIDGAGSKQWTDSVLNNDSSLLHFLLTLQGACPDDELRIVVESTGRYHYPLVDAAGILGIPTVLYNPILTKQQIKASVRGQKTDKSDAVHIARIGLRGDVRYYTPEPYRSVKHYVRGQQKLGQLSSDLKRYEAHLQSVLEVELTEAAKDVMTAIQQQLTAARRQFVADTLALVPTELIGRLRSIPGIGPFIAASIIAEVQDMHRFPTAKALIAFAGLDPKIRQSGHTLNSTGRLTKRGSPHLRRSLFIAASVARQHDPYFKALYDKKRAEGKKYTAATVVVARKLLSISRAVWLSEQNYNLSFWEKS